MIWKSEKKKIAAFLEDSEKLRLKYFPNYYSYKQTARSVAEKRMEKKRSSELHVNAKVTLDDLFNQIQQGELKELPLSSRATSKVPSKRSASP